MTKHRAILLGCATVWLGCASPALVRPTLGDCAHPEARLWFDKAAKSLVIQPYQPRKAYDQDARNQVIPFAMGPLPPDSTAVLSYPYPERFEGARPGFLLMRGRSFVYDDALVALWLTSQGDHDGARRILQTLAALQRPDGAWGFGFQVTGDGFYNAAYVRTGAVAWAIYALARWQSASHDLRFASTLDRSARWLLAQKHEGNGLYDAGTGRWTDDSHFEPEFVANFAATEHQIDAWFALMATADAAPALDAELHLRAAATELAGAIERGLWLQKDERYAQGRTREYPDFHSALDASGTWAALYALAAVHPGRAKDVLDFVQVHHQIEVAGWQGLRPYQDQPPETWFVEGSLARPLALHRLGQTDAARKALQPFTDLACAGGVPLVYSPVWAQDFPLSPATAPTVWFLFAASEIAGGQAPFLWTEKAAGR